MVPRQPLNDQQRRLLRITARMPLASVANLAPVLGLDEENVRRMLGNLRRGGWVTSVVRGMTERRQHRWFLTRRAVDLLYVTDHQHPAPREEARATGLAAFHPEGELPQDYRDRFALDHDHPVHLEGQGDSPFAAGEPADGNGGGVDHEHPPWTATSRGIETSLRHLAMLEPVYRLATDLIRSGRVSRPARDTAASRDVRMADFRLLRHGGFCLAVPEYGPDLWTLLRSLTPVSTPPSGRCGARSGTASGALTAIPRCCNGCLPPASSSARHPGQRSPEDPPAPARRRCVFPPRVSFQASPVDTLVQRVLGCVLAGVVSLSRGEKRQKPLAARLRIDQLAPLVSRDYPAATVLAGRG